MQNLDIKQIRESLNLTQQEFANKLGMSLRSVQNWEAGGVIPQSKHEIIRKLVAETEQTPPTAEVLQPGEFKKGNKVVRPIFKEEKVSLVPVIHVDSVGGVWSQNQIMSSEQYIEGYIPFVAARPEDVAIKQSGSSMDPTIPSGSMLHLRQVADWREYFGYGNVYVLWLKDDRRITKEIRRYSPDPSNYVLCHSYNPSVADEELPKSFIREVWKVINILTPKGW